MTIITVHEMQLDIKAQLWKSGNWQIHHNNVLAHEYHLSRFYAEKPWTSLTLPLLPRYDSLRFLIIFQTQGAIQRDKILEHIRTQDQCDEAPYGDPQKMTLKNLGLSNIFFNQL